MTNCLRSERQRRIEQTVRHGTFSFIRQIIASGESPFMVLSMAVANNRNEIVKDLMQNYTMHEIANSNLLHVAAKNGNEFILELLLKAVPAAKSYVDHRDDCGETALHAACQNVNHRVLTMLIMRNAEVNAIDKLGKTPLHIAAYYGPTRNVEILLAAGADVNARSNDGKTPLLNTVYHHCFAITQLLIDSGADVNAKNIFDESEQPRSTLFIAMRHKNDKVVELMFAAGVELCQPPEETNNYIRGMLYKELARRRSAFLAASINRRKPGPDSLLENRGMPQAREPDSEGKLCAAEEFFQRQHFDENVFGIIFAFSAPTII